jgi:3D (Asp-Asp-Asp) domain-containing protein
MDSIERPWMIPMRLVLFPWYFLPRDGTVAADTRYYPFGTRMYVPGYGWGRVEDRGGAIKGPDRIDLYFSSHQEALRWGRRKVRVTIEPPQS